MFGSGSSRRPWRRWMLRYIPSALLAIVSLNRTRRVLQRNLVERAIPKTLFSSPSKTLGGRHEVNFESTHAPMIKMFYMLETREA